MAEPLALKEIEELVRGLDDVSMKLTPLIEALTEQVIGINKRLEKIEVDFNRYVTVGQNYGGVIGGLPVTY